MNDGTPQAAWGGIIGTLGLVLVLCGTGAATAQEPEGFPPPIADPASETAPEPEQAPPPATEGQSQPAAGPSPTTPAGNGSGRQGQEEASSAPGTLWEILRASGIVGLVIILLSIAAVALVVEHSLTLRAKVLMPPGLAEDVHRLLNAKRWQEALALCREQPSVLGHVLAAGLGELDGGWSEVEKAMEDAVAEQAARLSRKTEYLSVIGNIAPMLGLLGTVVGMILAFRNVAETQGAARAADLAEGIYLALVTTVEGLIVAIPSLAAFAFFRNRVDELIAETAAAAQHACRPLKRLRVVRNPAPAPPERTT